MPKAESTNANHETEIVLRATAEDLKDFQGYSELSIKILEDFLKPEEEHNLNFPSSHPLYHIIKFGHLKFVQNVYYFATKFIEGYDGGNWVHGTNGIYCRWAEPTERFHISNPYNYSDEVCNPLETFLAITLIALGTLFDFKGKNGEYEEEYDAFVNAMVFFRSKLMQLIEEQYEDGMPYINTSKVLSLID